MAAVSRWCRVTHQRTVSFHQTRPHRFGRCISKSWLARIESAELVAVDTETNALGELRAQIVGLSFSVALGTAACIPLMHDHPRAPELLLEAMLALLKPWLETPAQGKLGQNVKLRTGWT